VKKPKSRLNAKLSLSLPMSLKDFCDGLLVNLSAEGSEKNLRLNSLLWFSKNFFNFSHFFAK